MGSILHDKEFGAGLHNPQAEGDDLHREEEVDHLMLVGLDGRADHDEGGEEHVLDRARLEDRVQEREEVERDVGEQECRAGVGVRGHALEECERVDPQAEEEDQVEVEDQAEEAGLGGEHGHCLGQLS